MRKTLHVLLLLSLSSKAASSQTADLGKEIYARNAESVVLLYAQSSSGELIAQGSGFVVDGGKIVTNAHVANSGKIFLSLGQPESPTRIDKIDNINDLAVLSTDVEITARPLKFAKIAPSAGETVFAIGNPEGLEKTISQGPVAALRTISGCCSCRSQPRYRRDRPADDLCIVQARLLVS